MKRKILIVILCLACMASYAQTKKKTGTKGKGKTATYKKVVSKKKKGSKKPVVVQSIKIDTTRKIAAIPPPPPPAKPFDRPLDGYFRKSNILDAKVTPYPNLREADVAYQKRIWREIDVREKMNEYFASPKGRLIDILTSAITAGELTAYDPNPDPKNDPDGDAFSRPLSPEAAFSRLADSTLVEKRDKDNNVISSKYVRGDFNPDSILKFRIKEDWIFDKQRSVLEPRIVGIAPMIRLKGIGNGDWIPAFWIYFKEARPILATKEVVNHGNDATGLSFDDVFTKRLFVSYIVKQSNDKDERIKDYATGIDRLYESERIKKALLDWELNLWQY